MGGNKPAHHASKPTGSLNVPPNVTSVCGEIPNTTTQSAASTAIAGRKIVARMAERTASWA